MSFRDEIAASMRRMGYKAPPHRKRVPPRITTKAVRVGRRRSHNSQLTSVLIVTFCSMMTDEAVGVSVNLLPFLPVKDAMRFVLSCKMLTRMFGSNLLRRFIEEQQVLSVGLHVRRSIGVFSIVERAQWSNKKHTITVDGKMFVREKHWMIDNLVCFKEEHRLYGVIYRTMHGQVRSASFTRFRIAQPVWVYVTADRHMSRLIREVVTPTDGPITCLNELAV